MLRLVFTVAVVLLAVAGLAAATDCDSMTSKSACATASCSWCTSGAVGDSCVSPEDAAALPSAVFSCSPSVTASYHFMTTSSCEAETDADKCTSTSGCSWCDSAAVGSSCMSSDDAAALPSSVFTCKDASVSYQFLAASSCEAVSAEDKCTSTSGCSWCDSAAVGFSCMSSDDAAALPSAVFTCKDAAAASVSEAAAIVFADVTKVENECKCGSREFCCNTCDKKLGGCTCSTDSKCPAGVGALRGAEGFEYVMRDGEVLLTASTDYFRKSQKNELGAVGSSAGECSTANYLRSAGFPEASIGTMVCIAKWESSFNCVATNHNTDGSTDYGLFEINSYYWCSGDAKSKYNECNVSCQSLVDCQANANCAHKVYQEQGYKAWYGYQSHSAECDAAVAPSC